MCNWKYTLHCLWREWSHWHCFTVSPIHFLFNRSLIYCCHRGNCIPGLYCDTVQMVCLSSKVLGESCSADKEYVSTPTTWRYIDVYTRCGSLNCMNTGVCGISASSPRRFGSWVYVFVALGIIGGEYNSICVVFLTQRMTIRYGGRALRSIPHTQEAADRGTCEAWAILARTGSLVTFTHLFTCHLLLECIPPKFDENAGYCCAHVCCVVGAAKSGTIWRGTYYSPRWAEAEAATEESKRKPERFWWAVGAIEQEVWSRTILIFFNIWLIRGLR